MCAVLQSTRHIAAEDSSRKTCLEPPSKSPSTLQRCKGLEETATSNTKHSRIKCWTKTAKGPAGHQRRERDSAQEAPKKSVARIAVEWVQSALCKP